MLPYMALLNCKVIAEKWFPLNTSYWFLFFFFFLKFQLLKLKHWKMWLWKQLGGNSCLLASILNISYTDILSPLWKTLWAVLGPHSGSLWLSKPLVRVVRKTARARKEKGAARSDLRSSESSVVFKFEMILLKDFRRIYEYATKFLFRILIFLKIPGT